MAEFQRMPTQEELQKILYMGQMQGKTTQEIINENLAKGGTVKPLPENFFTTASAGAKRAGEYINRAGTAADVAKLFPGYQPETKVTIPTSFSVVPKVDPYSGQVMPTGLQTQQAPIGNVLQQIKPADVLGVSGAERAYGDIGAGKAPQPMDVIDTLGVGAVGMAGAKGLLGAARATKGLPVGMSIQDVTKSMAGFETTDSIPSLLGKEAKDAGNYKISEEGGFYNVIPKQFGQGGQVAGKTEGAGIYAGTAAEARGRGQSIYGVTEQEANGQVLDRLKTPEQNPLFNIANQYTSQNLGQQYNLGLQMPSSSLAKQSGIGRSYEIMTNADKTQKDSIFNAYASDPEYARVIEQNNIKDYDDLVRKSYQQLEKETVDQFRKLPYKLQFHTGQGNYLDSSEAVRDMVLHNNLTVYRGGDRHEFLNRIDPETGLNSNEMFRAVHDAFGHGIRGNSFGPVGEEIAWGSHSQMYSPLARIAMTSETRGQNSFVNYTPINTELVKRMEELRKSQYEARRKGDTGLANEISQTLRELGENWQFAKQSSLALPPEFTRTDFAGGMPEYLRTTQAVPLQTGPEALTHFGRKGGLLELSPSEYGSGIAGEEAKRIKSTINPVKNRTYFYRGSPDAVKPEPGLGPNVYTTELQNLYDINADPLGLGNLSNVRNTTSYAAKYGQGRFDNPQYLTDLERLTKEYGYRGLLDPDKVIVWDPTQVKQVR